MNDFSSRFDNWSEMLAHWKTGQKKIRNEANIGKNVADIGEIILKKV